MDGIEYRFEALEKGQENIRKELDERVHSAKFDLVVDRLDENHKELKGKVESGLDDKVSHSDFKTVKYLSGALVTGLAMYIISKLAAILFSGLVI